MSFRPVAILATLLLAGALTWRALLSTPKAAAGSVQLTGYTMGGTWSVKLRSLPPSASQAQLQTTLDALIARLDGQMSNYKPTSDLSRFNATASTDWIPVPFELVDVARKAQGISDISDGAFDITVAPLVNLWGFGLAPAGPRAGEVPSDAAIASAKAKVDYRRLDSRLDPPALRKTDPSLAIDLGAIAKGYAADAVARVLDEAGVTEYLIAVGGELRARGEWRVGIEVPATDTRRVLRTLTLKGQGLSTSGDYLNFVTLNNHRYAHEIDPRTGVPINSNLASVSVVHPSNTTADAMATALFVRGPIDGYQLATTLHLAALFVTRDGDHFVEHPTPAFEALQK